MYLKESDLTSLQTSWHFIKRGLIPGNLEQSNSCQGNEEEQLTGGSPAKGLHPRGSDTLLAWMLLESHWKHILKENKPKRSWHWLQSEKGKKSKLNKILKQVPHQTSYIQVHKKRKGVIFTAHTWNKAQQSPWITLSTSDTGNAGTISLIHPDKQKLYVHLLLHHFHYPFRSQPAMLQSQLRKKTDYFFLAINKHKWFFKNCLITMYSYLTDWKGSQGLTNSLITYLIDHHHILSCEFSS